MNLPPELLDADARVMAIQSAVRFAAHLNPTNALDARDAFVKGAEAPPFAYAPATWADEVVETLDSLRIPLSHPLGAELAGVVTELRTLALALRDRTAERFAELARVSGWVAEDAVAAATPPVPPLWAEIPGEDLFYAMKMALRTRGLDWDVVWDPVMASRVLVDSARRIVRLNPAARFRASDRTGLVAHEIDVHVTRGENGRRQPLGIFTTGLARSLATEEGLAILAEERAGTLSPAFLQRQGLVSQAVRVATKAGFRELYEWLRGSVGSLGAWQIALRVKRGLAAPGEPGVYAKDTVYLTGYRRVGAWLAAGGDVATLYVGKVGIEHPIAAWLAEGWVRGAPVPELWSG